MSPSRRRQIQKLDRDKLIRIEFSANALRFGPASETFARAFHQALNNNTSPDAHFRLPLDEILVGASRSRSSDSLITDSAAGATAFSCALKSYNGAIGVDPAGKPCGTVFEAAKKKGLLTGVVVTSRLTDAVSLADRHSPVHKAALTSIVFVFTLTLARHPRRSPLTSQTAEWKRRSRSKKSVIILLDACWT